MVFDLFLFHMGNIIFNHRVWIKWSLYIKNFDTFTSEIIHLRLDEGIMLCFTFLFYINKNIKYSLFINFKFFLETFNFKKMNWHNSFSSFFFLIFIRIFLIFYWFKCTIWRALLWLWVRVLKIIDTSKNFKCQIKSHL